MSVGAFIYIFFPSSSSISYSTNGLCSLLNTNRFCQVSEKKGIHSAGGHPFFFFLYVYVCKPVWSSGKGGKQRDLGSNPLRLSFVFKSCGL